MIPKVIHYCWLSGDPFPSNIKNCMDSWKKVMPDYEWKVWNTKNFDIHAVPYVREAFEKQKWAFAADYIRMYALYTEGGIYLDSDVKILKPFDDFLPYSFFSSLEYHPSQIEKCGVRDLINEEGVRIKDEYVSGIQIQAAVMGAEAGNPFVKEVLDWYAGEHFLKADGSIRTDLLSPQIYARIAEKYGFRYLDKEQDLQGNMKIFPSEIFAGNKHERTSRSYAVHLCAHSWHPSFKEKMGKFFHRLFG
ncbi:polysaccharide biosynthesis protein CpsM(V) [gut metagenome]|uniref:Polysaccharide biosynthesis protein CpsM(V) n=1 Tax=gut metagenome TaxID=749906 RepID=J9H977_9ZZZZ